MLGTGGGWDQPPTLVNNGSIGLCPTSEYKFLEDDGTPSSLPLTSYDPTSDGMFSRLCWVLKMAYLLLLPCVIAVVAPTDGTGDDLMSCDNVDEWGEAVDQWLCSSPCTRASPCLYNLEIDPGERVDIASKHPSIVAAMQATLAKLRQSFLYPVRGSVSFSRAPHALSLWLALTFSCLVYYFIALLLLAIFAGGADGRGLLWDGEEKREPYTYRYDWMGRAVDMIVLGWALISYNCNVARETIRMEYATQWCLLIRLWPTRVLSACWQNFVPLSIQQLAHQIIQSQSLHTLDFMHVRAGVRGAHGESGRICASKGDPAPNRRRW
eukprot:COSAG05_NODE_634_length_8193_cov_7.035083_4_plen_324_part_00